MCGLVEDNLPNTHKALGLIPGIKKIKRKINKKGNKMDSSLNLQKRHCLANTLMLAQVNLGTTSEPQKCKIINIYFTSPVMAGIRETNMCREKLTEEREEPQSEWGWDNH